MELDRNHIYLVDGGAFAVKGMATVDPIERALVIRGEHQESYIKFNWDQVLYYSVNVMEI